MIVINVKYKVRPEKADTFLEDFHWFTEATRAEEGNLSFEFFRSEEKPNEFMLVEAFLDDAAEAHVNADYFARFCAEAPAYLLETPDIVNYTIEGKTSWDKMAEITVD
ncbi:MAG: putative quinol monooxygenase [Corynebacterium sp.]|nr:putative quinol monooxygenase [Corynebacterium sp.]